MAPKSNDRQDPPASKLRSAPSAPAVRSAAEVAGLLRDGIVSGKYAPNERLIELDLARDLQTNRAVVRGALTQLEAQRLVIREPNRGVRVRSYTAEEAAEILETRALLEGLAARRAAERIDAAGEHALRAVVAAMRERQAAGDLLGYSEHNARFHRTIIEIAAHRTASSLLAALASQAVRYQFRTVLEPGRPARSLAEHEAILDALCAHDGAAAERAMRSHIGNVVATVRAIGERPHLTPDMA
jgi:DNA-binding GntR family transcriptional regulator